MQLIFITVALLGALGFIGAAILFATSKKFRVEEDERINAIADLLPGANCGGCGQKGCRDFATACVSKGSLSGLYCPVSGSEGMLAIARILGVEAVSEVRKTAVLRCAGTCSARPQKYLYDGAMSCRVMDGVAVGTRGCSFGCLGCGDCVNVCSFGALHLNKTTGLPEIDPQACTACGKCVEECPRGIIELRSSARQNRRVWVACSSRDKGAVARRTCSAACIGCGKCAKECPFGAIIVADNLAYINSDLCKACGKCVGVCPTGAIQASFKAVAVQSKQSES